MIRAPILLAALLLAGSALAQSEAPAPVPEAAKSATAPDGAATRVDIERLRADFMARFVDYDERLAALTRRIEALEAELAAESGSTTDVPTDASAATMAPQDAPSDGATAPADTPPAQ